MSGLGYRISAQYLLANYELSQFRTKDHPGEWTQSQTQLAGVLGLFGIERKDRGEQLPKKRGRRVAGQPSDGMILGSARFTTTMVEDGGAGGFVMQLGGRNTER